MRTRSSSRALTLAALALLAASCGGSSVAPDRPVKPAPGGVLRYVLTDDPVSVTPLGAQTVDERTVARTIFAGLYDSDAAGGGPVPVIARSASASSDLRTFTFRLRTGVLFTDGEPVTSETFARDWSIVCATAAPAAPLLRVVEGCAGADPAMPLSGVETPAPDRLVVHLTTPFADLPAVLANPGTWAFPPDLAATAPQRAAFERQPVGCGAFRLVSWVPGRSIMVVRTSAAAPLAGVRFQILSGAAQVGTAASRFRSGQVDATPVPGPQLQATMADPDLSRSLVVRPTQSLIALLVPPSAVPDQRLRVAIARATDPVGASGPTPAGTPADGVIPIATPGYVPGASLYPYDPSAAASATAGLRSPPIRIAAATPTLQTVAAQVAAGLRAVGLRATTAPPSTPGAVRVAALDAAYPAADAVVGPLAADPAARALVRKARRTSDPHRRSELERAAAVQELRSATVIPLTFGGRAVLVSPRVSGAVFDAAGLPHFDRWGWLQSTR